MHRRNHDTLGTRVGAALALLAVAALPNVALGDDQAQLDAGEILFRTTAVKGSELPRATVRAVIDAPMERIWAIIERCADYKRTMVRVIESEELERNGGNILCRVKVDMPWPVDDLQATTRAVHTVEPGKRYRRAWSLVEGDYKSNEGSWTLTAFGDKPGRTMVVYEVHAEPKIAVPNFVLKKATRSTVIDLIERLRKLSGAAR